MIYTCHCNNYQHFTGSAFSLAMLMDVLAFHLTASHGQCSTQPRADATCRGGYAQSAAHGSAAAHQPARFATCALEPCTTPLGGVPPCIFGLGANSPGSYCPMSEATCSTPWHFSTHGGSRRVHPGSTRTGTHNRIMVTDRKVLASHRQVCSRAVRRPLPCRSHAALASIVLCWRR